MAYLEHTSGEEAKRITLGSAAVIYLSENGRELITSPEAPAEALAAVYHSKRSFVVVSLGRQNLSVNQCKVVAFKIIREGDQMMIGPHAFIFRELATEVLTDASPWVVQKKKKCLVDGAPFRPGDKVVYCPSCNTPHHERCWQSQKGRCANGMICQYQAPWDESEAVSI